MQPLISFIQINLNINDLFTYLTDSAHAERAFEHVRRVEGTNNTDTRHYRQTRLLHGITWAETVEVLACEPPTRYELCINMFGVETHYTYTLEAIDENSTCLHLRQTAHGKGLWKILHPLISHVFSRSEHDGDHLIHLKNLLEQNPPGQPVS